MIGRIVMENNTRKRVLLGLSGGLDSSFCASLLKERGYDVVGAVLIFSDCTDISAAKRSAKELSIPLVIKDVREKFKKHVIDYFADTYLSGGTPNPCTVCNRYVKMQTLYELSLENNCDFFATGHYASKVVLENGRYSVKKAADEKKDQSYMLWGMTQEQLSRFIAPLEDFSKQDIRKAASGLGLSSASLKESQDICFIKDGDYARYIRENYGETPPGNFTDIRGNTIGKHKGILSYTVGQRRGLDIALGYRAYVIDINKNENTVVIGGIDDFKTESFTVSSLNFMSDEEMSGEFIFDVRVRYSAKPIKVRVYIENDRATVYFEKPEKIPARGQSAVFYDNDVIAFGGIID